MSLFIDIIKKYKDFTLSVQIESSDVSTGILGASGCGKSLTLKSIAGIVTPDCGRIVLNDKVLFDSKEKINLPPQKRKVGYLFQSYALFPTMTVEQNIGAGITGNAKKRTEIIKGMIETFQLSGLEKKYPKQLSGGQQQRVALARMIASDAEILLLDEPFAALDYYLKEQLQEQLLEYMKVFHKDFILVTHDRDEVFTLCHNLAVMDKGHIVCSGNLKDIFSNPQNLPAARLTGCKNISKAKKRSEHEIYASDWNMILHVNQQMPDQLSHVGIRAHFLKLESSEIHDRMNAMEPELIEVMENPFEMNIIIRNKNVVHKTDNERIWWKISKEQWIYELHEKLPSRILFPSKDLLLLIE